MRWLNWIMALLCAAVLAACGGGGGSAGTPTLGTGSGTGTSTGTGTGTTAATPTISLALSSTTVTSAAPVVVTATILSGTGGSGVANQVVTFATTGGLGAFSQSSALTDSSGKAAVTLFPATSATAGADTVTATATVNTTALTASTGFQLTPTNVSISSFASDVGSGTLAAYGQTTLTVATSGAVSGAAVNVSITSACVTAGKAKLSATSASTTTGTATFTYQDQGCGTAYAADSLTATITGATASTALAMKIASPAASSIAFVSASPQSIFLKGSGYAASSTVTFQVVDIAGNPLPQQSVSMVATTYTGGLTLDASSGTVSKTSDSNGNVQVIVNSGTVPTPVRVQATLVSSGITTSSSNLTIGVGLPSQINFSLSEGTKNIEGMDIDGTPNTYSIVASDRTGNPVPAGTAISFVDSGGGQVVGSQLVALDSNGNARAKTTFLSSDPRPTNGRITIVAYALGEESFIDTNGNNTWDAGEDFQDLGDVFVSQTFSATYVPSTDQIIPYTLSGPAKTCVNASASKLQLSAVVPSVSSNNGAPRCDGTWGKAYVRQAIQTVLSTSGARPLWNVTPSVLSGSCNSVTLQNDTGSATYLTLRAPAVYALGKATGTFSIIAADANTVRLNPMAAGSTISATATTGITVTVNSGSPVANVLEATAATIGYTFAAGTTSGTITLNFQSPSGVSTSVDLAVSSQTGTACL